MNLVCRCSIVAIVLLCSSGLAWTAETGTPWRISDNLVLTGAQENLIWQRLGRRASAIAAMPAEFQPSLYGVVPPSVALHPLPSEVTRQIPMVSPYAYATLGNLVLIVNPADRTIVDIIQP
jgi:Protein of unknown function (DUF1236)